jgi:putative transcriptional regulator
MPLASEPRSKSFPFHLVIGSLAAGIALLALGGQSVPRQAGLPERPAVRRDQPLARAAAAQSPQSQVNALAKGKFLIAGRELRDPNFAESVVLLVEYNADGAMGLVINNRTEVGLSRLLPDIEELKEREDDLFIGGPVQRKSMLLMLVRSRTKPSESNHVFADVYVTGSVAVLEQVIEMGWEADRFRAYAGYAGWGAGQLDNEVARGDWHVSPADADTVFAPEPADVWKRLIERASLNFAWRPAPRRGAIL